MYHPSQSGALNVSCVYAPRASVRSSSRSRDTHTSLNCFAWLAVSATIHGKRKRSFLGETSWTDEERNIAYEDGCLDVPKHEPRMRRRKYRRVALTLGHEGE